MEIGRLVRDPREETRDAGMSAKDSRVTLGASQFHIGHLCMDGAVTDRMDGHGVPPSPAFRHGMMPFHPSSQRPGAEPATALRALPRRQDLVQVSATHLPVVFAFMAMFMPLGAPVIFMSMFIS